LHSIGRITKGLLLELAELVDIVEPVAKFTDELKGTRGIRHVLNIGLQDWIPPKATKYDLIWNQWCLGHLTDQQLVQYLQRCRASLEPSDGWIVIKENLSSGNADLFDEVDSSVTR
jgi:protein N-terminal methyltransferase